MYYEVRDFLETADKETLRIISNARKLTREYYFTDYDDTKRKNVILKELLGAVGRNVAIDVPLHCDYGKNIFLGDDVVINVNLCPVCSGRTRDKNIEEETWIIMKNGCNGQ